MITNGSISSVGYKFSVDRRGHYAGVLCRQMGWLAGLCLVSLLALSATAYAEAEGGTLVLGVFVEQSSDRTLQQAVEQRLLRLGDQVVHASASAESVLQCTDAACMVGLASQNGARLVLRVDVTQSAPQRYSISAQLVESPSGTLVSREETCNDCSPEQLRGAVTTLAAGLAVPDRSDASPPVSPQVVVPALRTAGPQGAGSVPSLSPRPAPSPFRWGPKRTALVVILTASLATSVVATGLFLQRGSDAKLCLQSKASPPPSSGAAQHFDNTCTSAISMAVLTGGMSLLLSAAIGLSVSL